MVECQQDLRTLLASNNRINLMWVPAHSGTLGNEKDWAQNNYTRARTRLCNIEIAVSIWRVELEFYRETNKWCYSSYEQPDKTAIETANLTSHCHLKYLQRLGLHNGVLTCRVFREHVENALHIIHTEDAISLDTYVRSRSIIQSKKHRSNLLEMVNNTDPP